jgi:succinoglycan biosynthesis transport protein ExoP
MSTELALRTTEQEAPHSSLNFHNMVFILFRHKWQIILFALAGIGAAVWVYFVLPRYYEAQTKLLVRYVVDKSAVDSPDDTQLKTGSQSDNLVNSEVQLLTTLDLAMDVAQAVGVDRLLRDPEAKDTPGTKPKGTLTDAGRAILGGLKVAVVKGTDIISISYKNRDPQLALQVLQEFVARYFDKHLEVHRPVGGFEFMTRETDKLRTGLIQTEEKLKQLKAKAGISSLAQITSTLDSELVRGQEELDSAKAESAAQQARVKQIETWMAGSGAAQSGTATHEPSSEVTHKYQALVSRVAYLRQNVIELQAKYTPENPILKVRQAQLNDLEKQQWDLEKQFPNVVARLPAASPQSLRFDLGSEKAQLAATEARIEALKTRLSALQERARTIWDLGPQIAQLELQKDVEEKNYKVYEASLEKARIDEALNSSGMPNISVVEKPALAEKASGDTRKKMVVGVAGAGLALGLALSLLQELLFDRTVKRRLELETQLRIPLLLAIPNIGRNGHLRLRANNEAEDLVNPLSANGSSDMDPWESGHFIQPFCQAIRDRLILYFERNRMTYKPKLVALTGCSPGAGASTIAAGLAASLSEVCDGKVLLVDKGLDPKRFYAMIAEYKASDFEYVIFDMPSLTKTGSTLAMASFMDKVLLVVEAEVSDREVVKRAYAELAGAKANVSAIFNKSRSYGPKWLAGNL